MPDTYPAIPATPRSSVTATPRIKTLEYGDGYQQVQRDGLNSLRREMTLVHEYLEADAAATLRGFLAANHGQAVTATTVGDGVARDWILVGWTERFDGNTSFGFSVTLTESH